MSDAPEGKDTRRNKAYAVATTALREKHREEFNGLLRAQYEALGLEPKFRKTAEEKAAAEAEAAKAKADKKAAKIEAKRAALQAELAALDEPVA